MMKSQKYFRVFILLMTVCLCACKPSPSEEKVLVSTFVCNDSDLPVSQVYLNDHYAGGGTLPYGSSGIVCCSRLAPDQPVSVKWNMNIDDANNLKKPLYKVTIPIAGVVLPDQDNLLEVHVDATGNAKVIARIEHHFDGHEDRCRKNEEVE
ncbi:hypothetical protein RGU70_11895 [Herbaspirillum sp. RTI4]|uniref:hypothetical protein n=1 Tax=Herbaspirillum sp. RTI4 TaxID=3048640 RepID=UPI002AB4FBFF|nr:hypothetical protein [Herbaspirillum sp. RTI4]MDY7579024.1 hypothetical protein [Herbaspirillum sp. RTI4]MEA9980955.1 hypothetical protein [Herbaspirillum sp. RTI4]